SRPRSTNRGQRPAALQQPFMPIVVTTTSKGTPARTVSGVTSTRGGTSTPVPGGTLQLTAGSPSPITYGPPYSTTWSTPSSLSCWTGPTGSEQPAVASSASPTIAFRAACILSCSRDSDGRPAVSAGIGRYNRREANTRTAPGQVQSRAAEPRECGVGPHRGATRARRVRSRALTALCAGSGARAARVTHAIAACTFCKWLQCWDLRAEYVLGTGMRRQPPMSTVPRSKDGAALIAAPRQSEPEGSRHDP